MMIIFMIIALTSFIPSTVAVRSSAFVIKSILHNLKRGTRSCSNTIGTSSFSTANDVGEPTLDGNIEIDMTKSPWNADFAFKQKKPGHRFRQHVNPLARKYQMPTDMISEKWPHDGTYTDPALPLHIDIGCGKGGFLLSLAKSSLENNSDLDEKRNYLGLEIRPSVVKYAKDRIPKRKLDGIIDFVGCNANVDLDRLLYHYTMGKDGNNSGGGGELALVSIQFPDPHFKKQHQKRRVVTPELVQVLTKHVPVGRKVFIQSDIKDVLDNMRLTIREEGSGYFNDEIENIDEYMENNPTGVPTEREISVLEQDLPVYRTMFVRTDTEYNEKLEE